MNDHRHGGADGQEPGWPTGDDPDLPSPPPTPDSSESTGMWWPDWDSDGAGKDAARHRLEDTGLQPDDALEQRPAEHLTEMMPVVVEDMNAREPELLTHRAQDVGTAYSEEGQETPDGGDPGSEQAEGKDVLAPTDRVLRKKRRWRRVRRTVYVLVGLFIVLPVLGFFITYQVVDVPSPQAVIAKQAQPVTYYWSNGKVMYRNDTGKANRQILKPNQIPVNVKHAVEAAEDATFETNAGFDISGIMRAMWNQVTKGEGGGSTISQQYIKQATGNDQHTYVRKAIELVKAYKLNNQTPKPQILAGYLNIIYLGRGAYGIGEAAKAYFGTDVGHLSTEQAAYLAGLIQGPSRNDDHEYVRRRWNYVMNQMVSHQWMSQAERESAELPTPVPYHSNDVNYFKGKQYLRFVKNRVDDELASKGLDPETLKRSGAKIYLTLNPKAEKKAVHAAREVMSVDHKAGPDYKYLNSALVAADPSTGKIIAYYGGDWERSKYDMANVPRQPGSSFKPIDFAAAMRNNPKVGIGTTYDGTNNQVIAGTRIGNAGGEDCGTHCSVMRGMTQSVNTVFYNMAVTTGTKKVRSTAFDLGVPRKVHNPQCDTMVPSLVRIDPETCTSTNIVGGGIAIGKYEVTPRGMVQAYATLANQGERIPLHFVSKVTDNSGKHVLYRSAVNGTPALDKQNPDHNRKIARNVTQSMLNVARYSGIPLDGDRPVAAKTGTAQYAETSHNAAAWTIGYTPRIVTGVWVGNWNEPSPIYGTYHNGIGPEDHYDIYGREEPGYIWKKFMDSYLEDKPVIQFSPFQPLGDSTVSDAIYAPPGQVEDDSVPAQTEESAPTDTTQSSTSTTTATTTSPTTTTSSTTSDEPTSEAGPTTTSESSGPTTTVAPGGGERGSGDADQDEGEP